MKSEKESTKLNQTISSKGDIDRKVEEVLSEVEKMPDFEVPVGKIFLNPDEISNTEWKKENMETFQKMILGFQNNYSLWIFLTS